MVSSKERRSVYVPEKFSPTSALDRTAYAVRPNARTIIINENTGTRFTLSEDCTELLLDGEPCGRLAGTEGSLWVTGINTRGENIIITVDA